MKQKLMDAAKVLLGGMGARWESPHGIVKYVEPGVFSDGFAVELSDGVWKIAGLLATDGDTGSMILALYEHEREDMRTIGNFSNLAQVSAYIDDYALAGARGLKGQDAVDFAEKRHQLRTLESLDEIMLPAPITSRILKMCIEELVSRGVKFGISPYRLLG